ncbi:hypothetical protein [Sphingomonas sp. Leaf25]|uniref:hypothetical protein n=1 Tax=Sphingomonas sp. Leaf25 TaxID=1735692 RepID=UPI0006F937D4|nr:hypothetical protein [Sphingomonas sp. Leaf25]KQN00547.1 hypothetical protein ASE78_05530 [Sphingomonas sp. Leaf25]
MILTPGAYIAYRRKAAGLGIEDVARAIATVPGVPEHRRGEWVKLIEADVVPACWRTIVVLRRLFHFDLDVLELLSLIAMGEAMKPPVLCVVCAENRVACLALGAAADRQRSSAICLECASSAAAAAR